MSKFVLAFALTVALLIASPTAVAAICWPAPVSAPVVDPFRSPACAWCSGNRGIEFGTEPGVRVRAVATGRVSFSGSVAGTVYVVMELSNGWRLTYGNLRNAAHDIGDLVVRGTSVGVTAGHLHFGLRVGDRYLDPAPHLGRLEGRPRLIPIDGTPPRPAPAARLRCG